MNRTAFLGFALLGLSLSACERRGGSEVGLPPSPGEVVQAPDTFSVAFETSKGTFQVRVNRGWAPVGADRFYQLVQSRFFDDTRFFRVVTSFMVQFGVHGDPEVNKAWEPLTIPDDPNRESNKRGMITYAHAGPGTRTTQVFINLIDNGQLDAMGFPPFGMVTEGMAVVDSLFAGYGDGPPAGFGPDQIRLIAEGNGYLAREYPKLDFIRTARVVGGVVADSAAAPGS